MERWLWKVGVGLALVVVGMIMFAGWKFKQHEDDPGGEACDQVSAVLAKEPAHGDAWDARITATGTELEASGAPKLTATTREERCHQLFNYAYHTWRPKKYEALEHCVKAATSADAQVRCFDLPI